MVALDAEGVKARMERNARSLAAIRRRKSGATRRLSQPSGNGSVDARAILQPDESATGSNRSGRAATDDDRREYLELALEYRRRVKEQLKKMGSFEYYQTSFSYTEVETMQERFVGVPEEGGRDLISPDPLPPGSVYTATLTNSDKVALNRVEVSRMSGNGRLRITGNVDRAMRESIATAFDYLRSRRRELGIEKDLDSYDLHVQVVDLMAGKEGSEAGVAFFVALYSLLKERPVQAGLVVLGEMTIQGNILPIRSLQEPLRVAMDNGARKGLVPVESRRSFFDVPGDVAERVDPIFYSDPLSAAHKVLT
jgi:ATP-dependent Lon protease